MTNQEAKQQAIDKAWIAEIGHENYDKIKYIVDEKGAAPVAFTIEGGDIWDFRVFKRGKSTLRFEGLECAQTGGIRPKSLSGIDNNEKWIRIEPDGSNLPTENGFVCYFIHNGVEKTGHYSFQEFRVPSSSTQYISWKEVSHYQPIEKTKPPKY